MGGVQEFVGGAGTVQLRRGQHVSVFHRARVALRRLLVLLLQLPTVG